MAQPNNQQTSSAILIDNQMIQYFLSKDVGKELAPLLEEFNESNIQLTVSQIVVYEALKAVVFNKDKFEEINNFFKQYVLRYPIDEDLLMDAARVHEMYGYHKNTKEGRHSISTEDIIIATTAIRNGMYLVTCDVNDFPAPFFKEIGRQVVFYKVKDRTKHIVVYLLAPDTDVITATLSEVDYKRPI